MTAAEVRLLGAAEVRAIATELGLRPSKRRGQNFVIDPNTVRRIVRTAAVTSEDVVLEVGPGLGSLTLGLAAAAAHVIAIEIDPRLAGALPTTLAKFAPAVANRVSVVRADALRVADVTGPAATALVANLPYNVAVPVLLHLMRQLPTVGRGLVMVQAEVADRLTARPGSRRYGIPSAKTAWYAELRPAGRVSRTVFWPVPNVDSGLVAWHRREPPPCTSSAADVFAVVDAAFAQRRKTLRAALTTMGRSATAAEHALTRAGVSPGSRGESIDIAAFARITDALAEPS
ncbi:MAG: 16S rRNA (adenine(1518)-N(6)/adenine(1519)-N(6))-dimethyltransferase RsmA [Nocardioidaceae bacterium]|nr:16S rRNA (adenine(1518)-N(6)/adenine(1519)-N(6))-dimethyltransferase RsmA [Nocardioidaceae bacterium]